MLALDSHLDTPLVLDRAGFDITRRHDWMTDYAQVDLPRMKEGGLDGGFWVIYTAQGPLTADGYAKALAHARQRNQVIDDMVQTLGDDFAPAVNADDAARMTSNSEDRAGMAGARMLFAYLGAFSVVALAGGLLENADSDREAFMSLAVISGILATVIFWICFAICREPPEDDAQAPNLTIKQSFISLRQNTPFLVVFAAVVLMTTGTTVIGKTMIYFFEYQMGDRNGAQIALMAFGLTGLLVIPFWTFVTLKTSKRLVWMVGSFFLSLALLAFLVNPATSQNMVILNYIAMSFGAGAFAITFWGMLPDTVEYGEWKTGHRVESMVFGFATFAQKSAVALSALILGVLLDVIGYQAGIVQSEETLSGFRMIIVFVPLAGVVTSVACIYFYPLSPQRHADIVAELQSRAQ